LYRMRALSFKNPRHAEKILLEMGVDPQGAKLMAPKTVHICIRLDDVPVHAAQILKQEMLSLGGDAAVARGTVIHSIKETPVILMGTYKQYRKLISKLKMQPFKLAELAHNIAALLEKYNKDLAPIKCGSFTLPIHERTVIMGILNITPDSFSDGGKYFDAASALEHAHQMVAEGADIIDVGAESTRPGHLPVDCQEELKRLTRVLDKLLQEIKVPVSVDTYKASTAEEVLKMGVHIINDVWGLKKDAAMAGVIAKYKVPVVIMHNQEGAEYNDLMADIIQWLRDSIAIAQEAGIEPQKIIIDPGIGFGKTLEHNLEVMDRLDEFKILGKPLLIGTSRKSIIGKTLNLPVEDRVEGTAATVALGIARGASIVRVHDVKEMVRVCKMMDAMVRR